MSRKLLLFAAVLCIFSVGIPAQTRPKQTARQRPNVLFIPIDDLRPDFETYGNFDIKTPNIMRIAKQGVTFQRAFTQQALCNPSRASLMTGLRPDSLRVWDLQTDFRTTSPDAVTIPQHFRANGYTAIGIGKVFHNIFRDEISWTEDLHIDGFPFDPDAVYANEDNLDIIETKKQQAIANGNSVTRIDKYGKWYLKAKSIENADVDDDFYYDGAQTTLAIEQLRKLKDGGKPFFLGVGYYRPHLPFNAPKKYWDMYVRNKMKVAVNQFIPKGSPAWAVHGDQELRSYDDVRDLPLPSVGTLSEDRQREKLHGYAASVSYIDAQIGRLLDALDSLGLAENTIIVLWGDHGWKLGEHNGWGKMSNYEIDVRVPLIIAGKGVAAKGRQSTSLVEFVDVYPTLNDMAGISTPKILEGKSLLSVLRDPSKKVKNAAFSQYLLGRFPIRPVYTDQKMGYAMRTDKYRYIEWYEWDLDTKGKYIASELFDHTIDPNENVNLALDPKYKKVAAELAARLKNSWPKPR